MQIIQIDLENVKSYRDQRARFAPGTNAICGPNGAGKSTLLEAVGFALFDFLAVNQDQFVREGEKVATVTVHLADDEGRRYQVVRKCGSYSQFYVYDPEIEQKLADGKADTMAWLYRFLGVDESGDLAALFQDAVGVPQGLLTAAFLDRPANRKNTFNPLLRVDEYEQVWGRLRDPRRQLENRANQQEKRIAGLEAEAKGLPGWQEKAADLNARIETDQRQRDAQQAELNQVSQRKDGLEALKKQVDQLNQALTRAEGELKTLDARLTEAQAAVERAQVAQSAVAETKAGHQAYQAAQENLNDLEAQRRERDRLNRRLQAHTTDRALIQQQIEGLEQDLQAITEAEAELEALRPRVEAQDRLEEELAQARRDADRLADARHSLEQERARLTGLQARLQETQAKLDELTRVEAEIETARAELERLSQERDDLTARQAGLQAELDQMGEQTAALEAVDTAQCPVCEAPLTPEHRAELLARNQARQETLRASLDEARSRQLTLEKEQSAAKKSLRQREKQARQLPRPAEAETLAGEIETQKQAVAEARAGVEGLAAAPAEVERLEAELTALGDPRRGYQRAADEAGRRGRVEKELAEAGQRADDLGQQIADLETALQAYRDLDQRIEAERAAREAHTAEHQRYLRHVDEAAALDERRARVEALEQELETAQAEHDRLAGERDRVAAGYDPAEYAALAQTYERLRDEVATLEERLRQRTNQLAQARAEIERLQAVAQQLESARAEHDELLELLALLNHLRGVLRDAGPKVTQALVEVISLQAARLYADIMADHATRLRWTQDYQIVLSSGGRERDFQQLSGGEQMAAALAVRLALLREVSAIDVAFFDEPTANLDERRRDNLAEQILNVKGFSQLFVISHDDTFERDTDHVLRVSKENGVSRVEA